MSIQENKLEFISGDISLDVEEEMPHKVFRYFDTDKVRENFLMVNIWFAGRNQNRFFNCYKPDEYEYRNSMGLWAFEYSLSCSTEIIDETKFNVEITNLKEFLQELCCIKECLNIATIFEKDTLSQYVKKIPSIALLNEFHSKSDVLSLYLCGVGGRLTMLIN